MFTWLRNWRQRRRMQRLIRAGAIYAYWDGQKVRYGDPFRIWRELTQDEKVNLERLLPELDEARPDAVRTALAHICRVFDVQPWDGYSGLTDLELLNLLGDVLRWTAFVKKNTSPGPTSSPAIQGLTSAGSPDSPAETKSCCSACTSTATGSTPGGASTCCEPSALASTAT